MLQFVAARPSPSIKGSSLRRRGAPFAFTTSATWTTTVQASQAGDRQRPWASKEALHIYVGLAVQLAAALALRTRARAFVPALIVVLLACIGVILDMQGDINSLGRWRWAASVHDVVSTAFWPVV